MNIDCIYEKHPFIERYAKRKYAHDVNLAHWSKDFLSERRSNNDCFADLLLLDSQGRKVARVAPLSLKAFALGWVWSAHYHDETVAQTLTRIGRRRSRRVTQALQIKNEPEGLLVTLYKLPRDYTDAYDWNQSFLKKEHGPPLMNC